MRSKRTSYRDMLRDRVPDVVEKALRYCGAKTRWVEHVYKTQVGIYVDDALRKQAVRTVLSIRKGKSINFDFHKSIDWDNLSKEDTEYWEAVESWVRWFSVKYQFIENEYEISGDIERIWKFIPEMDDKEQLFTFCKKCLTEK